MKPLARLVCHVVALQDQVDDRQNGEREVAIPVDSHVQITVSDSDADDSVTCTGVVIEAYPDMVFHSGSVGAGLGFGPHSMTDD